MNVLTVGEVAERLKVNRFTIYKLHGAGKMPPAVWVGGSLRWTEEAINEWIKVGGCTRPPRKTKEGAKHAS